MPTAGSLTWPGTNVIRLFTVVIYELLELARVVVPGGPLQPSLMFVGDARSVRIGSDLTYKHQDRLERLARDKHKDTSLLRTFVNYDCCLLYTSDAADE